MCKVLCVSANLTLFINHSDIGLLIPSLEVFYFQHARDYLIEPQPLNRILRHKTEKSLFLYFVD